MAGVARQPGPARSGDRQSNSHIVALLSLKILLLAFFILLNALSSFEEERRAAVVESVREAFQGLVPAEHSVNADPSAAGVLEGAQSTYEALKQVFSANLELVEDTDASGALILKADLEIADLFADTGLALRPDGAETLRLVAGVLSDPRLAARGYQVDVLYGLAGGASGLGGNREALLRAAALVRYLERDGLAPARLSAGLMPDFPGRVRLHFTLEVETPPPAAGGTGY